MCLSDPNFEKINYLEISPENFKIIFRNVLDEFVKEQILLDTKLGILRDHDYSVDTMSVTLDGIEKFNSTAKNKYEYFQKFYEDFYDYNWILFILKEYADNYKKNNSIKCDGVVNYDNLIHNMVNIVDIIVCQHSKCLIDK
jgi:hypothetical protein